MSIPTPRPLDDAEIEGVTGGSGDGKPQGDPTPWYGQPPEFNPVLPDPNAPPPPPAPPQNEVDHPQGG